MPGLTSFAISLAESYAFSVRNTVRDDKFASKLDQKDKEAVESAVQETLRWLDNNQNATPEEYEHRQQELEQRVTPIMVSDRAIAGLHFHSCAAGACLPGRCWSGRCRRTNSR